MSLIDVGQEFVESLVRVTKHFGLDLSIMVVVLARAKQVKEEQRYERGEKDAHRRQRDDFVATETHGVVVVVASGMGWNEIGGDKKNEMEAQRESVFLYGERQ